MCLDEKNGVTLCAECGTNPAHRKFCSSACRQAAYRKSPAHAAILARERHRRAVRRAAWQARKRLFDNSHVTFDGRVSASRCSNFVPRLTGWHNEAQLSPEEYLSRLAAIRLNRVQKGEN